MTRRLARAWRALAPDQRLAGLCAAGLLGTMFLPWYQESVSARLPNRLEQKENDLSAFEVFTFIEAAVLLVAVGVLVLLFARGEGRRFHLPGGDGTAILAAGGWVALLIFIRQLDKPEGATERDLATTIGVQWGIFVAFVIGLALASAGWRIRAAHHPEPPLHDEPSVDEAATRVAPAAPRPRRERRGVPPPPDNGEQLTFDEPA